MKNNYKGFSGWIRYIRDYKDNVDNDLISEQRLIDANRVNSILEAQLKQEKELTKERENALQLAENRIQSLNEKYSELKKEIKTIEIEKANIIKEMAQITNRLETIEYKRRVNAVEIGHRQRKINKLTKEIENLKQELAKKDHTINFLKSSKHAPTKEEIEAYELRMKEVEKRIKSK